MFPWGVIAALMAKTLLGTRGARKGDMLMRTERGLNTRKFGSDQWVDSASEIKKLLYLVFLSVIHFARYCMCTKRTHQWLVPFGLMDSQKNPPATRDSRKSSP